MLYTTYSMFNFHIYAHAEAVFHWTMSDCPLCPLKFFHKNEWRWCDLSLRIFVRYTGMNHENLPVIDTWQLAAALLFHAVCFVQTNGAHLFHKKRRLLL